MIKFNKGLFEIAEQKDKYKHFLVFLVRKFYGQWFNGTFTRSAFINTGINKYGYKKKTIEQIFDKGIKNNSFVLKTYIKRNKKYYVLISNINKKSDSILIGIKKELLNKVHLMSDFYNFSFIVIASCPDTRSFFNKYDDSQFDKIIGRTFEEIGRSFGNMPKNGVHYHITKGKALFNGYFNVIGRKLGLGTLKISIANLYFLDRVKYSFIKTYNDGNQKSKLYVSKLGHDFRDMTNYEIKSLYKINVQSKKGVRTLRYDFGNEVDFGKQFFNNEGIFLYDDFYSNYYENMKHIMS